YFVVPAADLLHAHRERSFGYGYLHIGVVGSIVAPGAGLHAAADFIEHKSAMGSIATVLAVAIPVGVYITPRAAHLHRVEVDQRHVGGVGVDITNICRPQFGQWA